MSGRRRAEATSTTRRACPWKAVAERSHTLFGPVATVRVRSIPTRWSTSSARSSPGWLSRRRRANCGVALDTFASSLVCVNGDGRAVTPCYTYADSRCGAQLTALRRKLDEEEVQQRTGCSCTAATSPARLRWLRKNDPDRFGAGAGCRWASAPICGRSGQRRQALPPPRGQACSTAVPDVGTLGPADACRRTDRGGAAVAGAGPGCPGNPGRTGDPQTGNTARHHPAGAGGAGAAHRAGTRPDRVHAAPGVRASRLLSRPSRAVRPALPGASSRRSAPADNRAQSASVIGETAGAPPAQRRCNGT